MESRASPSKVSRCECLLACRASRSPVGQSRVVGPIEPESAATTPALSLCQRLATHPAGSGRRGSRFGQELSQHLLIQASLSLPPTPLPWSVWCPVEPLSSSRPRRLNHRLWAESRFRYCILDFLLRAAARVVAMDAVKCLAVGFEANRGTRAMISSHLRPRRRPRQISRGSPLGDPSLTSGSTTPRRCGGVSGDCSVAIGPGACN